VSGESRGSSWLTELFAAIDAQDMETFLGFLSDDIVFRFGSAEAVSGHDGVSEAVGGFFSSIAGLKHTVQKVWTGTDSVICEGQVCYTRHDGSELTVPFADSFDMRADKICGYRIYIDISDLYAE
jgi:ketosteroid isomerase-like protein